MKRIAIDTNVLLDFQLQRAPGYKLAKKLITDCLEDRIEIAIPPIVFPEMEWVLRSVYKDPKDSIINFFEELLLIEKVITKDKIEIQLALELFKTTSKVNFTDTLILVQAQQFQPDEFLTFDEELKKIYKGL